MKNFDQEFEFYTWWSVTKPVRQTNGLTTTYPHRHIPELSGTSSIYKVEMEATTLVSAVALGALGLLL